MFLGFLASIISRYNGVVSVHSQSITNILACSLCRSSNQVDPGILNGSFVVRLNPSSLKIPKESKCCLRPPSLCITINHRRPSHEILCHHFIKQLARILHQFTLTIASNESSSQGIKSQTYCTPSPWITSPMP